MQNFSKQNKTFSFFQVLGDSIRSHNKFEFVIKILEASLQDIVGMWDNGEVIISSIPDTRSFYRY